MANTVSINMVILRNNTREWANAAVHDHGQQIQTLTRSVNGLIDAVNKLNRESGQSDSRLQKVEEKTNLHNEGIDELIDKVESIDSRLTRLIPSKSQITTGWLCTLTIITFALGIKILRK